MLTCVRGREYDVAAGVVDGDVVEGVEVVREGGVCG
jgi:hypothetical protein